MYLRWHSQCPSESGNAWTRKETSLADVIPSISTPHGDHITKYWTGYLDHSVLQCVYAEQYTIYTFLTTAHCRCGGAGHCVSRGLRGRGHLHHSTSITHSCTALYITVLLISSMPCTLQNTAAWYSGQNTHRVPDGRISRLVSLCFPAICPTAVVQSFLQV